MRVIKAHAYGNDFLLAPVADLTGPDDVAAVARRLCARHTGIGADGLMLIVPTVHGAQTRLLNADGSPSEISGNGLRCVVAWLAEERDLAPGTEVVIDTGAGERAVQILARTRSRVECRAAMGQPRDVCEEVLDVAGERIPCVTLNIGNPQCVVLGDASLLTSERLHTVAAGLAIHPRFPEGTNVELATIEAPGRVRILIWERGVGPTEASGTGACAAAIAAVTYGGATSPVNVVAPGGTQQVDIIEGYVWLTGWAEVTADIEWRG